MTREEAINVLVNEKECVLRETCERLECASCELVMPVGNILSAYDIAIDVLREQEERENPTPLTLDELRQMDGEPVWLETGEVSIGEQICGSWEIFIGRESAIYYFTRRKRGFFAEHYGKTWLAYRSKPKEAMKNE